MSAIKISSSALTDIDRIFQHLCNFDVKVAITGNQALSAGFQYLSEHPQSGEKVQGASGIRKSVVDTGTQPYWVFHQYDADTNVSWIVRIIHPHLTDLA